MVVTNSVRDCRGSSRQMSSGKHGTTSRLCGIEDCRQQVIKHTRAHTHTRTFMHTHPLLPPFSQSASPGLSVGAHVRTHEDADTLKQIHPRTSIGDPVGLARRDADSHADQENDGREVGREANGKDRHGTYEGRAGCSNNTAVITLTARIL